MYLSVTKAKPLDDYKLLLTFENDEKRVFNVTPYLGKGIFAELKDQKIFTSVKVEFDTISWANGADLDPEILYEDSLPLDS
jgi:hypothetical protein